MRGHSCKDSEKFLHYFRVLLFTFLFSLIDLTLFSQPCFERAYGGALNEEPSLIRPTFDHGYILVGTSDDTVNHTRAYYVLKLDSMGDIEWSKSYGDAFNQQGSSIVQTFDSGYAFIGSHNAVIYNAVAEVVKISPDGTLLNSKTYPPFDGWGTQGIGIIATDDSSLAISSYTDGFISQNYYSLTKLNLNLSSQWTNFVSFNGSVMNEHDAAQGTGSRIFTIGHYSDFYYTSPPMLNVTEVRQFDSNGLLLMDSLYSLNSMSNSISPTRDGGMLICGDRDTLGDRNIIITLLDSSGTLTWQKELGGPESESGRHARQTKDGGYVILCSVPHMYFPLLNDILLMKVNAQGDSLWSRTFGATYDDVAIHMQETYDGGFIILGKTNSFDSSHIYIIKTDSMGLITAPYKITGPGNYFCSGDSVLLKLDPVPSNCLVEWSNGQTGDSILVSVSGNYNATITDSLGQSVTTPNYFLFFATLPDANLGASDTIGICKGGILENLVPSRLSFTYTWQLDDTLIANASGSSILPYRTGKYTLQVDNYCGSDTDSVILDTLFELPAAPVMNLSGTKFICAGDSLALFIPDFGLSYQWWYGPGGNAQQILGASDTVYMANSGGSYFVQASDTHGCSMNSLPLNIVIDEYPAYVNTSGPLSFCQGGHVILSTPQGSDFLWNTGDTTSSIFVESNGDFWYSMTSMFGCPKLSDTVMTEVYLKPYINLGPDTTICSTDTFNIDAGPGYSTYLWQDGSVNQVYRAFTTASGIDTGLFYVDVSDVNACYNRDTLFIYFDVCQYLMENGNEGPFKVFPSLISADERFYILNFSADFVEINILNLLGENVFRDFIEPGKKELQFFPMNAGVYLFRISRNGQMLNSGKLIVQ